MISLEKVFEAAKQFYDELRVDEHGRFHSWEYFYKAFYDARLTDNPDIENLSLNLAFYLASWGMYRGSSFILQKDYKIHIPVVKQILAKKYDILFGINCSDLKKEYNIDLIMELSTFMSEYYSVIREQVSEKNIKEAVSDVLITKILMGTLGCVPAYDRYFKSGLSIAGIGIQKYGRKSLFKLVDLYENNYVALEEIRKNMNVLEINYPQMKILDMGFWKIGFDADTNKGHQKSH